MRNKWVSRAKDFQQIRNVQAKRNSFLCIIWFPQFSRANAEVNWTVRTEDFFLAGEILPSQPKKSLRFACGSLISAFAGWSWGGNRKKEATWIWFVGTVWKAIVWQSFHNPSPTFHEFGGPVSVLQFLRNFKGRKKDFVFYLLWPSFDMWNQEFCWLLWDLPELEKYARCCSFAG